MNSFSRRSLLFFLISFTSILISANAQPSQANSFQEKLAALEKTSGARIGVAAVNTANDTQLQYRANERFPMGCTSKVIGVATILEKSMADNALLQQKMSYTKQDLATWSPVTEKHVQEGMTVEGLCAAAISYSDNTAMNLLVKKMGGLNAMNTFARSINNDTFRQDHAWPAEALSGGPGNVYDSSTPASMEKSLQQLTLGNVLAPKQRDLLVTWLKNNTTGDARIRAGVPKGWTVGDKTGTGFFYGTTNDIGIIWPTKCAPIVVAIYVTHNNKNAKNQDDLVATTARLVLDEFATKDTCYKV